MDEEDKIVTDDPILANKVNRFDSEFKFNEEDDLSGEDVEEEDPFPIEDEDDGFQATGDQKESESGEIN